MDKCCGNCHYFDLDTGKCRVLDSMIWLDYYCDTWEYFKDERGNCKCESCKCEK